LTNDKDYILGNCLVAAGMVSYAGPFISQYREGLEKRWREKMTELNIKYKTDVTMRQVLGHDVTIRQWGVAGLPSDNLSIENGIIMFGSRRWPLMIDPQTQAKKFIKKMGDVTDEIKLNVCKMSDHGLIRTLELAIQFG
jgi:dynein heavy chain